SPTMMKGAKMTNAARLSTPLPGPCPPACAAGAAPATSKTAITSTVTIRRMISLHSRGRSRHGGELPDDRHARLRQLLALRLHVLLEEILVDRVLVKVMRSEHGG